MGKLKLGRDFIVGLTENMPSFFVLAAMSLGWPLEYLCCAARNVNEQVLVYFIDFNSFLFFCHYLSYMWYILICFVLCCKSMYISIVPI